MLYILIGDDIMRTKFGNTRINHGYYQISSKKEGNWGKMLHRLVYEDYYGVEIPKGYVIHHKDGNKLNNDISNLEMMSVKDHLSLHHKGKITSKETKDKIRKSVINKLSSSETRGKLFTTESLSKYTLWSTHKVNYNKSIKAGNKAFRLRYNSKDVSIGLFRDFRTVEIIHDLIEEFSKES